MPAIRLFIALVLSVAVLPICSADEIRFEVETTASGSLGGMDFDNQLVTISGVGDIDDVMTNGSVNFLLQDFTAMVEIDGLGSAVFVDAVQAVSNNNSQLAGFGNTTTDQGLFFVSNSIFADYDLRREVGPVTGNAIVNFFTPHVTTSGNLLFSSSAPIATFEATVSAIPEPHAVAIIVLSGCGLAIRRRRA